MIHNKKEFYGGAILMVAFALVFVFMFQPVLDGKNSMAYLDDLYNAISKQSAYYIPDLKPEAAAYDGKVMELTLKYKNEVAAAQSAELFVAAGAQAQANGMELAVQGDLGRVLDNALADADLLYHNDNASLEQKYGIEGRRVLYNWWNTLKAMDVAFSKKSSFAEAKVVGNIGKKAVETAYNYYTIEPVKITDRLGVVIFSLVFYVVYTMWYGFAILFLFEGWGLKLGSH